MTEDEFVEIVGRVNEAAFGIALWSDAGAIVARALDCSRVTLLFGAPDGLSYVDLMARTREGDPVEPPIPPHYRALDPSLAQSVAIAANRLDLSEVAHIFEMVPEPVFRRSQYYADFARRHGFYHRLGFSGIRGGRHMAPFAVHRAEHARPFDETDRAALLRLKPHIKRALALGAQIASGPTVMGSGLEAFTSSHDPAVVVDGDLRVLHANAAAEILLRTVDAPLRVIGGVRRTPGPLRLATVHRHDAERLGVLVRGVASGALAGGMCRLRRKEGSDPGIAVRAAPLPARLFDAAKSPGAMPGQALLVISDLRRGPPPQPLVMATMFGLSPAEVQVTTALLRGATAEAVALHRNVAVQTVRTQVRTILAKVGADNLRDLERIMARLPAS